MWFPKFQPSSLNLAIFHPMTSIVEEEEEEEQCIGKAVSSVNGFRAVLHPWSFSSGAL
jgi:hypothetical protein